MISASHEFQDGLKGVLVRILGELETLAIEGEENAESFVARFRSCAESVERAWVRLGVVYLLEALIDLIEAEHVIGQVRDGHRASERPFIDFGCVMVKQDGSALLSEFL